MTIPAQDHYTEVALESVATSNELATKLQNDISIVHSEDEPVSITLLEAQCIASQLRVTANLIESLLKEHNTIMVRVNELIDEANKKKRGRP